MKIAFATLYDTKDINRGSGTYHFMSREIERQGHDMFCLGPIQWEPPLQSRLLKKLSEKTGKKYRSFQDIFCAKEIGKKVSKKLGSLDCDVFITNDYSIAAYVQSPAPIILYTDSIFPRYYSRNQHPWLDNLFFINVWSCQYVNAQGLKKADLVVFPTTWAKDEALLYGLKEEKIRIIPFGANLEGVKTLTLPSRSFKKILGKGYIDLLFVGNRDWFLKGGEVALGTLRSLKECGIPAYLHIVGVKPPYLLNDECVRIYGTLNKANKDQRSLLEKLYLQSDVLIVPSRAEGFGIVFAEAAAYGLPSLSYETTGITTSVKNGESGILLKTNESGDSFAKCIARWYSNPTEYDVLTTLSRKHFENTVNWPTAISRFLTEIEDCINR